MHKHLLFCTVLTLSAMAMAQIAQAPLSLNSAIELGLKNNPGIHSAREKVKAAGGRFWSNLSPPPTDFSISHDVIPANHGLRDYGEKTIGISQSFDFPTHYLFRGAQLSIEEEMAENEFQIAELTIVSRIKTAYFNALAQQQQLIIAEENKAIARDFVRKSEVRQQVGEGTGLERLTANVQYAEASNTVGVQKNRSMTAFAELTVAMGFGKERDREFQLTDTLGLLPMEYTPEALAAEAAKVNPALRADKLRVRALSREKALAWSGFLPAVTLGYYKETRDNDDGFYGASLGLSLPLWFFLDQQGRIREAGANASAAQSDLRNTENSIFLGLNKAHAEFKDEESRVLSYQKDILPQSGEIYRTASKSYEAGEITYLEFLQAQQTIMGAKSGYIEALLAYNLSIVSIEDAVGKRLK